MHLSIVTPDKNVFAGEVTGVKVPGTNGSFELLNHHAPIISTLGKGEVRITTKNDGEKKMSIDGGILEMLNDKVIILAESIV